MGGILTKEQLGNQLNEYYKSNYGESGEDTWFEPPAANVFVFARGDKLITLKCHILSGEVSESIEPYTTEI